MEAALTDSAYSKLSVKFLVVCLVLLPTLLVGNVELEPAGLRQYPDMMLSSGLPPPCGSLLEDDLSTLGTPSARPCSKLEVDLASLIGQVAL